MVQFARGLALVLALVFLINVEAAVIAAGVKIKVSNFRIEKDKTFFEHKKKQFVYPGVLKLDKEKEIFFNFEEFKILLRENKIALGGVAGGGGGK